MPPTPDPTSSSPPPPTKSAAPAHQTTPILPRITRRRNSPLTRSFSSNPPQSPHSSLPPPLPFDRDLTHATSDYAATEAATYLSPREPLGLFPPSARPARVLTWTNASATVALSPCLAFEWRSLWTVRDSTLSLAPLADPNSRRRVLAGLAATTPGLVWKGGEAATCRPAGSICREHANCCGGLCGSKDATGRRRCVCDEGSSCGTGQVCLDGACAGNGACPPGSTAVGCSATCSGTFNACRETIEGGNVCVVGISCSDLVPCTSTSQCPPGSACASGGSCGGFGCRAVCDVGATSVAVAATNTPAGRFDPPHP